jgi:hypothetical protein
MMGMASIMSSVTLSNSRRYSDVGTSSTIDALGGGLG